MQVVSVAVKAKPHVNPWKKLRQVVFKFRLRRPILFFKPFSFRFRKLGRSSPTSAAGARKGRSIRGFLFSVFRRRRGRPSAEEMDQVEELRGSAPEGGEGRVLFPSPITPAYLKRAPEINAQSHGSGIIASEIRINDNVVEDACRSFEKYLAEMIVEERRVKDVTDVEELLYCWKNLKCPVFHDLVCRFYGELCMDLFSGVHEGEEMVDSPTKYRSSLK